MVKNLPGMWFTWVQPLGWKDPLQEGLATHASILAWRTPLDRGGWQATVHGVTKSQICYTEHRFCFMLFCLFVCLFFWPWPGIKPVPPALEGKVLATVLPGKSHNLDLKTSQWSCDELTLEFNRKLGRPTYCIHPDEESGDLYQGGCIGGVGSNWILHIFILFWSQQDFLMESINWVKQSSSSWKWSSV